MALEYQDSKTFVQKTTFSEKTLESKLFSRIFSKKIKVHIIDKNLIIPTFS